MALWRIVPSATDWRAWDEDEHVLYHAGSGDIHLLNDFAADVLLCLQADHLTLPELVARLAVDADHASDLEFQRAVQSALETFDELGLVERLS